MRWRSLSAEEQTQYNGKAVIVHREGGGQPDSVSVKQEVTKLLNRLQELVSAFDNRN